MNKILLKIEFQKLIKHKKNKIYKKRQKKTFKIAFKKIIITKVTYIYNIMMKRNFFN